MAKNKKPQEIYVVKPKIGEKYYFKFAGSIQYGTLFKVSESLSKAYGYPYFWFYNDGDIPNSQGKLMTYPVGIYNILSKEKNV